MIFNVITLFPECFPGVLGVSVIGKALNAGLFNINVVNLHEFAKYNKNRVDDSPYGGGPGMVICAEVIAQALDQVLTLYPSTKIFYTSPRGCLFSHKKAQTISRIENITIICGRFEGIDYRVIEEYNVEEISIGDYVLSGGEIASMVIMESCIRLIPGVLGNFQSTVEESFFCGIIEGPCYTRPRVWRGHSVPEELVSGNHKSVKEWKISKYKPYLEDD